DNTMVSEGCILNGVYARNSIIGLRSRIEAGVRIENSIVMGSDFYETIEELRENILHGITNIGIGKNTLIRKAIIDKNVRIGSDVRILNEAGIQHFDAKDGSYFIRDGIVIIPKNSYIPNGTVI
ncbi:MAG TPA: hypothetical protein VNK26_02770, partial [Pyrinomonadaceae bacterium]|nr:hypothetical protein [Pyrinomonadaceae bacterium]